MSESASPSWPSIGDRVVFLTFVYAVFFVPYALVNRTIDIDRGRDLSLWIDHQTPFVVEFMYPFYLAYVLVPMLGFFIRTRARLLAASIAALALIATSCALFVLFPVVVPRPESIPGGLAGELATAMYEADRPVCGFPSLHVSMSFIAAFIVIREHRTVGLVAMAFAVLTSAAVLFVKQHVVLDVVGGLVMAAACYALYRWLVRRSEY